MHPHQRGALGRGGFSQPPNAAATGMYFHQNPYVFQSPNQFHPLALGGYTSPIPPFPAFQIPISNLPDGSPIQNPAFPHVRPRPDPREAIGRVDAAVAKSHQDLLAAGEQVTAWKVSQSALMSLKVDSWGSLGFQMQDVPYLRRLMSTEGKVDAFIHCFVGSRKITSLHDLDIAICVAEGVERFEELGLGPLLRHPLVKHYFSVPLDAYEVPNITAEDIIVSLSAFVKNDNKATTAEEFLSFLMQKHSVGSKEMVGVRIQNLGFYITHIRQAKKAELSTIHTVLKSSEPVPNITHLEVTHRPRSIIQEKMELDRRFELMSGRIDSFSKYWKDRNTHVLFVSSSDDDSDESVTIVESQNVSKDKDATPRVSSCPYPSTTEEMTRLGLNTEVTRKRSASSAKMKPSECIVPCGKKRKNDEQHDNACSSPLTEFIQNVKAKKCDFKLPSHLKNSFELDDIELKDFMTTWKYQCQEHSVIEVLNTMLSFYAGTLKKRKTQRLCSMIEIFSSYPGIGLLNVSVASVKCGMIDTLYDAFESIGQDVGEAFEMIDVEPTTREQIVKKSEVATSSDIIKKLSTYVPKNFILDDGNMFLGRTLSLLKMLRDCESWLSLQFSVQKFDTLGHGDFCEFLYNNISMLPDHMRNYLIEGVVQKSPLSVSMHQKQLQVFISQAENLKMETCTDHVSALLRKQFPTVNFRVDGSILDKHPSDFSMEDGFEGNSKSIFFSAVLSCEHAIKVAGTSELAVSNDLYLPQSSSEHATNCLLKAPMLSDLLSWSHLDIVYAPSLGALLPWLLESCYQKNLSCIATGDGKLIRIDPSATLDDFLDASIQGSSFKSAVVLLSLVSIYGGVSHAPKSLLKQFAGRAMEVMINNSDSMNIEAWDAFKPGGCSYGENSKRFSIDDSIFHEGTISSSNQYHGLCPTFKRRYSVASNFILDCLIHLPSEFRNFAAEILVSSLQCFAREVYAVLLLECKHTAHRTMLHDIGLSLGIVEWIEDYNAFCLDAGCNLMEPSETVNGLDSTSEGIVGKCMPKSSEKLRDYGSNREIDCLMIDSHGKDPSYLQNNPQGVESSTVDIFCHGNTENKDTDAMLLIESIRRDEFGLLSDLGDHENILLQKQHARLGRALHCLSQELYSQDSHLLLELIQNADDNSYPEDAAPALIFILQKDDIVILNNEHGFTAQNIRALCDIGSSTKRSSSAGYIGNKGIGFKSVFRITDAPEIHSNGFHMKFDTSVGQIGFVLPTVISPFDISACTRKLSLENELGKAGWRTCIVLPFRPSIREGAGMNSIINLFSDLHPSLLLFLHRLKCIQLRNMLDDTHVIMKKEVLNDGIVRVSHGNSYSTWLVVKKTLQSNVIRADVQSTEIAVAFTLLESDDGAYTAHLSQQPVFAFLPLRQYGLRFILQGDFVLPSSREEVDGNSAWNQWLLSEIPSLFISAERSFCELSCFKNGLGKAVSTFLSFVPLPGEVHGFFSSLPNMILSKLRISCCLLLEGYDDIEWFPPCRVLRGWDEQAKSLMPDAILQQHLGLGYLRRDISISDSLARALGVRSYTPKILVDVISSMCQVNGCLKQLGLDWLASFLVILNTAISSHSMGDFSGAGQESDLIHSLKEYPFIPLSDGTYCSIADGPVWLYYAPLDWAFFPSLYGKLRTVDPLLFSAEMSYVHCTEERRVENIRTILHRIGVKELSAHEIIRTHIMHHFTFEEKDLMIEYLTFIMLHFQYSCSSCLIEKDALISELRSKPVILTSHGFKCPTAEPIHFGTDFGNSVNIAKLVDCRVTNWNKVDSLYLKHSSSSSLTSPLKKWRNFFLDLGVTDFVQVTSVERVAPELLNSIPESAGSALPIVMDWESSELLHLLSTISIEKNLGKSKYLLEVLDRLWDKNYAAQAEGIIICKTSDERKVIKSSFMKLISSTKWVSSKIDKELHCPIDLYHDCDEVRSVLGPFAPYANPKINSCMLLNSIGVKTHVTAEDAVRILQMWASSDTLSMFSTVQMSTIYQLIWEGISISKEMSDLFKSRPLIFVPLIGKHDVKEPVHGSFLLPNKVYWHDPTGCVDQIRENAPKDADIFCKGLDVVYPVLHDFFINVCSIHELPCFSDYMELLLQLASVSTPNQVSHVVLKVFLKWADDIKDGSVNLEEVDQLKRFLVTMENKVLPTEQNKWVSLHPTCGLICWSDDEELKLQFKHAGNVDFLLFGNLNDKENIIRGKISSLMKELGIPALSEVVSREAIVYGMKDSERRTSLINWILPYVQRYVFKLQSDRYTLLRKMIPERLDQLQICVVESLFYKHTLIGKACSSRKRIESSCLLQGNMLYIRYNADSHDLFLEFSRAFFDGTVDLQLANFLHMIATMMESGSSSEQIDFFVVNSQKIPKLPVDEPVWSLSSLSAPLKESSSAENAPTRLSYIENVPKSSGKPIVNSNWPPTDWKNVPEFTHNFVVMPDTESPGCSEPCDVVLLKDIPSDMYIDGDWTTKEDSASKHPFPDMETMKDQFHLGRNNLAGTRSNNDLDAKTRPHDGLPVTADAGMCPVSLDSDETLSVHSSNNANAHITGRLGEAAAYAYFADKVGPSSVKWVNKELETGLPYDLIIDKDGEAREYIEVKSTKSKRKNWFPISTREWQFAAEKGEAFSIARVVLTPSKTAQVSVLRNPVKLCQKRSLHLALLMPLSTN